MPRPGLLLAALAAVTAAAIERAPAQVYPTRQITLVVPFAAGGGADVTARIIVEHMRKSLGQPIIIENVTAPAATSASAASRARRPTATRWSAAIGART